MSGNEGLPAAGGDEKQGGARDEGPGRTWGLSREQAAARAPGRAGGQLGEGRAGREGRSRETRGSVSWLWSHRSSRAGGIGGMEGRQPGQAWHGWKGSDWHSGARPGAGRGGTRPSIEGQRSSWDGNGEG